MNEREVVMLSDARAAPSVAEDLARHDVRVDCFTRLEDLFGEIDPGAIPVLIVHTRERPKGRVLEVIGRLAVEHPRVQMVAVSETPLSLEVAEYLAGRGVDVMEVEPGVVELDDLTRAVLRMQERRQRSLATC
jgi:hypothetical protein